MRGDFFFNKDVDNAKNAPSMGHFFASAETQKYAFLPLQHKVNGCG